MPPRKRDDAPQEDKPYNSKEFAKLFDAWSKLDDDATAIKDELKGVINHHVELGANKGAFTTISREARKVLKKGKHPEDFKSFVRTVNAYAEWVMPQIDSQLDMFEEEGEDEDDRVVQLA